MMKESRLRDLVDELPFVAVELDGEGRVVFCNRSLLQLTGWRSEGVLGRDWFGLLFRDEERAHWIRDSFFRSIRSGTAPASYSEPIVTRSDQEYPAEWTTVPLRGPAGEVVGAVCVGVISEAERVNLLEGQLAFCARLLDGIGDAVIATAKDLTITYWSRTAEVIYGWKSKEVIGRNALEVLGSMFEDVAEGPASTSIREMGWYLSEFVQKDKGGSTIFIEASITVLRDAKGRVSGYVSVNRDISQRRAVEEALKESEGKLRELIDGSPAAILELSPDGTLLSANGYAERYFGFTKEELVGRKVTEVLLPPRESTGRDLVALIAEMLAEPERHDNMVNENVKKDGQRVWFHWTNRAIRGEDGKLKYIISVGIDITERKKAEDRVAKLTKLHTTLIEANQSIVRSRERAELMTNVCRILVQKGGLKMAWIGFADERTGLVKPVASWGDEAGYLAGVVISTIDVPEGKGVTGASIRSGAPVICQDIETDPRLAPWRERALARGYRSAAAFPFSVEGKAVGSLTVYAGEPHYFDDEEVKLLVDLSSDISYALAYFDKDEKRRRAVKALKESEERYRALFAHSPVGLAEWDLSEVRAELESLKSSGIVDLRRHLHQRPELIRHLIRKIRLVDVNEAFLKIYEAKSKEDLADLDKVLEEETYADFLQRFVAVAEGRLTYQSEVPNRTLKGVNIIVDVKYIIPPGYEGTYARVLAAVVDVTRWRKAEEELRKYGVKLESMVSERTRELQETHEKLLAAERQAAIGRTATQIAHDLRNPLTTIRTGLFYVKRAIPRAADEKLTMTLGSMDAAVEYADEIVERLLEFSRSAELRLSRLRLDAVIRDAIKTTPMPDKVEVKNGDIPALYVDGDAFKLLRVFQNIIGNAVDAMPNGGRLEISGERKEREVVVRVADSGVGISEKDIPKLFTPFFTTKAKGLGLGLYISKRFVEGHGGRIEVESRSGEGTVVVVMLPAAKQIREEGANAHEEASSGRSEVAS